MGVTIGETLFLIIFFYLFFLQTTTSKSKSRNRKMLICLIYITDSILYLCLVAVLWGVTNPFIKKGAQGLENVKASSVYRQFIKELVFLVSKLKVCHISVSSI